MSAIKLTPELADEIVDIASVKEALDTTLRTALRHHAAEINRAMALEKEWWKSVRDQYNLDVKNIQYRAEEIDGEWFVTPVEE